MMKLNIQIFAVPFRKVSKTRGRKRRTHYKISENSTIKCPKCGAELDKQRVVKAKYVAEHFLEDARLVNQVRNVYAYTGTYKGKEVITKEETTN